MKTTARRLWLSHGSALKVIRFPAPMKIPCVQVMDLRTCGRLDWMKRLEKGKQKSLGKENQLGSSMERGKAGGLHTKSLM